MPHLRHLIRCVVHDQTVCTALWFSFNYVLGLDEWGPTDTLLFFFFRRLSSRPMMSCGSMSVPAVARTMSSANCHRMAFKDARVLVSRIQSNFRIFSSDARFRPQDAADRVSLHHQKRNKVFDNVSSSLVRTSRNSTDNRSEITGSCTRLTAQPKRKTTVARSVHFSVGLAAYSQPSLACATVILAACSGGRAASYFLIDVTSRERSLRLNVH